MHFAAGRKVCPLYSVAAKSYDPLILLPVQTTVHFFISVLILYVCACAEFVLSRTVQAQGQKLGMMVLEKRTKLPCTCQPISFDLDNDQDIEVQVSLL